MLKVLVVDDDPLVACSMERVLGHMYDVSAETDPARAVSRLDTEHFDVVVCDGHLPGRDGLEVLRAVRNHSDRTIVILASGAEATEAEQLAADGILLKPFGGGELRALIASLVDQSSAA